YTHYTSLFVLAVQGGWSLWICRRRIRQPLIANALVVLLYLPWISHLHSKVLYVIGHLYRLSVSRVLTDLLRPIPGHPAAPLSAIPTVAGLAAVGACVVAGLIAVACRWRGAGFARPRTEVVLLVLL